MPTKPKAEISTFKFLVMPGGTLLFFPSLKEERSRTLQACCMIEVAVIECSWFTLPSKCLNMAPVFRPVLGLSLRLFNLFHDVHAVIY